VVAEHWYADEHKVRGLTLVVVCIPVAHLARCRAEMKSLVRLPKRTGGPLHFVRESDATKTAAFNTIATLPITVRTVTVPAGVKAVPARERAVRWIARNARRDLPHRLVLERDERAVDADRRWLRDELAGSDVEYLHEGKGEPLLWIADGIAWAHHRGGKWLRMVEQLIVEDARA